MILEKYSMGIGDRFARQGRAQLDAIIKAKENGLDIVPVWNKSHREHSIIGTVPGDTRIEADEAVADCGWGGSYHVDADHINLSNVDLFVEASDFFTLDVADYIGQSPDAADLKAFVEKNRKYVGSFEIAGIDEAIDISEQDIERIGGKFLLAVKEAGKIYRHIEQAKGEGNFITEVSVDESNEPQSPVEMLFILSAIADEGIPAQTIAPKFTG
ncbi:MAG: hypothetical protein J7M40_10325, partial [Planctomycetes bacterium]|nr:hypothetical protein [Planctomycetota bacterium]